MNYFTKKLNDSLSCFKAYLKKYRLNKKVRLMKGSQLELYQRYMQQLDNLENKHSKIVGVLFTLFLIVGLVIFSIYNDDYKSSQLYLTIIISVQILIMMLITSAQYFIQQPCTPLIILFKFMMNTMSIAPIELIIIEGDSERIVWYSYLIGILVIGISMSMKNKMTQIVSIFIQSFYLILRFNTSGNIGFSQYLIRVTEITLLSAAILYLSQDKGKSFLMDYFVENTKGNTAKRVIKSSLPLPVFATKLKTSNLDSSRIVLDNNLELDIVFANKFCRQIFNIKKKTDMKQKLKYLFLQGDQTSNNNNNHNNNNDEDNGNNIENEKLFEGTECGSPDIRMRKVSSKISHSQAVFAQAPGMKLNQQQPYKNDFYNLQRSQIEALSPHKDNGKGHVGDQQNFNMIHKNLIQLNHLKNESDQQMSRKESITPTPLYLNSKALLDGFVQKNQIQKQMNSQQFMKQNFTKQEIKDYGISQTSPLLNHILDKLYCSLFNRLRSEANGEEIQVKNHLQTAQNTTSIKDLTPQPSQIFDQQQEEVFLDVIYVDSEKKRRKFFDIKIIEVEWENENALMVIMNDISEKMRVKRMKEIDSFKNDILSTITHNLKTPLNGIILTAQSLQNQVSAKVKDAFSDILQNSKMLLYMINDILDYSRLSKGNIHLNLETFSILKLINEVLSIYTRQTKEKNIKLNYVLMGNLQTSCKLINDFSRIKQILINLVGNAAKCTFEGSITLIFEITSPNLLSISIKDTGIGMTQETIRSIQKIQMKRKKDMRHGVGIGLLIAKSLLQLVGPDKEFKIGSQQNQGSTFSFQVFLIHKKSNNCKVDGLEVSHLQNFFQIDKSMVVGLDINGSTIHNRNNYFLSRSRNNKINTILEEGKLSEKYYKTDDKLNMEFKECVSQKILPEEGNPKNETQPNQKTNEENDTQQNFLQNDDHSKNCNEYSAEPRKKDSLNLRKKRADSNFMFNSPIIRSKNQSIENHYQPKARLLKQDFDFKSLLQNQKSDPDQTSMDDFDGQDELDDGNVAIKYTECQIRDHKTSQVRVLPYHLNQTVNINQPSLHRRINSNGGSESQSSHYQDLFLSYESSPSYNLKPEKSRSHSNEKDIHQEIIPQNFKLNFYLNQQLTDSIYTQDSIINENNENTENVIYASNRSIKNHKLSQYNLSNYSSLPFSPQTALSNQSQTGQQLLQIETNGSKSLREEPKSYMRVDFNLSCSPRQINNKKAQSLEHGHNNTSEYISHAQQLKLREKLKGRQQDCLSDSKEKYQILSPKSNSSVPQQLFKFNSNVNLEDSRKGQSNYHGGQGRIFEYVEESRDLDEIKQLNFGQGGMNRFNSIQSSTTLTADRKNGINLTISQNIPYYNMRHSSQQKENYQGALNGYFEQAVRHILIVDDTVFNIKALRNLLLKYKTAQIEEAFNGLQAVQKVQQTQFDIIFMDINMPVMDGFEATKQIRELQKQNKISYNPIIIIVTAFGDQENKMLSFQSGADEHIEKPLTLDSIQKTIYQFILR